MTITPVERPAAEPFPIRAVTPEALAKPKTVALKPMAPKVPNNSVTPLEFGFKYATPCGILTVYTLNNGERHAISEMMDWITLHIKKTRCTPCDVAYYGTGSGIVLLTGAHRNNGRNEAMATQEQKAKALATQLAVEVTYEDADDHIEIWPFDAVVLSVREWAESNRMPRGLVASRF